MSGVDFKVKLELLHRLVALPVKKVGIGLALWLRSPGLALMSAADKVFLRLGVFTRMNMGGLCK